MKELFSEHRQKEGRDRGKDDGRHELDPEAGSIGNRRRHAAGGANGRPEAQMMVAILAVENPHVFRALLKGVDVEPIAARARAIVRQSTLRTTKRGIMMRRNKTVPLSFVALGPQYDR